MVDGYLQSLVKGNGKKKN